MSSYSSGWDWQKGTLLRTCMIELCIYALSVRSVDIFWGKIRTEWTPISHTWLLFVLVGSEQVQWNWIVCCYSNFLSLFCTKVTLYKRQSFCICALGMPKFVLCESPVLVMHQTYACRYRFVSFCSFLLCFLIRFECLVFAWRQETNTRASEQTNKRTNKRESTWKYAWFDGSASRYHK